MYYIFVFYFYFSLISYSNNKCNNLYTGLLDRILIEKNDLDFFEKYLLNLAKYDPKIDEVSLLNKYFDILKSRYLFEKNKTSSMLEQYYGESLKNDSFKVAVLELTELKKLYTVHEENFNDKNLFNQLNKIPQIENNENIFVYVIENDKKILRWVNVNKNEREVHHSSLVNYNDQLKKEVLMAGNMTKDQKGRIIFENKSGHFAPRSRALLYFIQELNLNTQQAIYFKLNSLNYLYKFDQQQIFKEYNVL